jgi:hypothetical protein
MNVQTVHTALREDKRAAEVRRPIAAFETMIDPGHRRSREQERGRPSHQLGGPS